MQPSRMPSSLAGPWQQPPTGVGAHTCREQQATKKGIPGGAGAAAAAADLHGGRMCAPGRSWRRRRLSGHSCSPRWSPMRCRPAPTRLQPLVAAHLAMGGVEGCSHGVRPVFWHPGGRPHPGAAGALLGAVGSAPCWRQPRRGLCAPALLARPPGSRLRPPSCSPPSSRQRRTSSLTCPTSWGSHMQPSSEPVVGVGSAATAPSHDASAALVPHHRCPAPSLAAASARTAASTRGSASRSR